MEDLLAKFLPQFVSLAHTRIKVALDSADKRDPAAIKTTMRELHTLAGEAGLLGLGHIVPLARDCEQKAKHLHTSHTDADVATLVAALRELEQVIVAVGEGIGNTS
ncbi:MAG TPA: Hpt domain-containing protein [Kofleriaceae bacterium]